MDLSPDAWAFLGLIVGQGAVIVVAVINNRSTKRQVAEVQETAQAAVDYAEPTGNGFAGKTLGSLERLESLVADLRGDVRLQGERLDSHLERHADRPRGRWRRARGTAGAGHTGAGHHADRPYGRWAPR